ncbi:DNA polymerase III subunit delta' [Sphingomonas donggukensis]|uniref:DNA polymerase III subunit delta n=1 Tax=Sphingomonas donggukensis TaxID=2949093 RepID=A0ABY4TW49_9SPHN|nr:DNA polymerase III subunit delta' [Sphingomonas donggukensis]URW76607.1 DNA polymerase III subunit delta' [Sphingomonas donggukensis]
MTSLIGNEAPQAAFAAALSGGALHHAWLIAGPEGVGKAQFAKDAAARILARGAGESERTAAMLAAGSHPDYRLLRRVPKDADKPEGELARSIKIDAIRGLQAMFATKPSMSDARVVIIDAIDDVERPGASNALLKNLEEPPAGTIFLLVSHAPGRLLPTIRSRCRLLRFDPLSDHEVAGVLRDQLPQASAAEVAALVRAGAGSPGRALRFAGLDLAAIEGDLAAIATDGDPTNRLRVRLSKALGLKAAQARYEAFLERVPAFIAERAQVMTGPALRDALDAYAAATDLARVSIAQSLDAGTTAFEMGSLVARLARSR